MPAGSAVRLSADLGCLLGDTVFADTELQLSDGSSVHAHSAVLAARWPQFREVCAYVCTYVNMCGVGWCGVMCSMEWGVVIW